MKDVFGLILYLYVRVRKFPVPRWLVKLNPALTDFKGPTTFICLRPISIVVSNIENVEKHFKVLKSGFYYRAISITGGSVTRYLFCKTV